MSTAGVGTEKRVVGRESLSWDYESNCSVNRSYVYFVQEGQRGPIKIGFAGWSPRDRLTGLQVGNPRRLRLIGLVEGTGKTERDWHARFESLRIRGEWFRATPDLLRTIGEATIDLSTVVLA